MDDVLREYIREALLAEYVVPMGYSLESWLKKKEEEGISNKEYADETKGDKWKVVHGKTRPKRKGKRKQRLKATKRGAPITKASTNLGYKRATDLHTAIKLTESSNGALREMMKRQRAIDLIVERLEGRDILDIALHVAADNPQAEFEFISDQANKFAKRADAMAQFDYLADPLGPRTPEKVEAYLKDSATEKLYAQLERLFLGQQRSDKRDYSFKGVVAAEEAHTSHYGLQGKDWEAPRYMTPEDLIRLKYQRSEDRTADYTPHEPTAEDIALKGSTVAAPAVDDTVALSEIYRKFGIL
mgnify:CR=1 FL=1